MTMNKMVELGDFSKGDFEVWTGLQVTDDQWDAIVSEVEGRVANYVDTILEQISNDIEEGLYE